MCVAFKRLLKPPFRPISRDGLIDFLTEERRDSVAVGYLNAHVVNLALRQGGRFARSLHQFDLLYADGMPIVRRARREGILCPERVSAADFFLRFCWVAAQRNRQLTFIGGRPGVADSCAERMQREVSALDVVYRHHGFFSSGIEAQVISEVQRRGAKIALLSMGSPQQEDFALRLRGAVPGLTVWCVGALFEYFSAVERGRAPVWAREAGLEWAFRLAMEPRRLAGRYLFGNAEFLLRTRGLWP